MTAPWQPAPSLRRSTACTRNGMCQVYLLSSCPLYSAPFQWRRAENNDVGQTLCAGRCYLQAQSVSGMERVHVDSGCCFWVSL